jgi:hypothetical protein
MKRRTGYVIFALIIGCAHAESPAPEVDRAEKSNASLKKLESEPSDRMSKRLQVKLVEGWSDHSSKFPEGPLATYLRDGNPDSGALQVSTAEYKGPKPPDLNQEKLKAMARDMGERSGFAEVVETSSGTCEFGDWGTATYRSDKVAHAQFWYLSDGTDIIFVSYYSQTEPDSKEVSEAREIVMSMKLVDS